MICNSSDNIRIVILFALIAFQSQLYLKGVNSTDAHSQRSIQNVVESRPKQAISILNYGKT